MAAFGISVAIGLFAVVLLHAVGRRERILTPILLFLGIEFFATWPALLKESAERGTADGILLATLTACSTLAAVVAYVLVGGSGVSAGRWRDSRNTPGADDLRGLGLGLWVLVGTLAVLSIWRLGGVPPMLTGGVSTLIDPLTHADKVAEIRETRRVLTKGYLVGEEYRGQGILNAFNEAGWQVAVIAAVLRYGWSKSSASLRQLIVVGVLAFVFLGSSGQRSPLLLAFVGAVGATTLLFRLSLRQVFACSLVGIAFLLFIAPLSKGEVGGTSLIERQAAMAERITQGNGQHNVAIVNLVDTGVLEERKGGLFVDQALVMVPGAPAGEPFTLAVTRLTYGAGKNTTGFSTPTNFGYLYADGRDIGVLLGYLAVGVVMGGVWRFVARVESFSGAVLTTQGAILLGYMSVTGLHGFVAAAAMTLVAIALVYAPAQLTRQRFIRSFRDGRPRSGPSRPLGALVRGRA